MHSFAPCWNRIPKTRKTVRRKEPGPDNHGKNDQEKLIGSRSVHRFGIESQKPGKPWGEKNLVHITPGKHGQEKLISSRSSLLSTTSARELKSASEYETKY